MRRVRLSIVLLALLTLPVTSGFAQSAAQARAPAAFEDTIAQRVLACPACHGEQGRATREGYFPRIAGKPAGYLFAQLRHFRDGRRTNPAMAALLASLPDDYLREIAAHFASVDLPWPPPQPSRLSPAQLARGRALALDGDPARDLPACVQCHGRALTGVEPAIPGLLGLSRDYLNAQFGGWRDGLRHAAEPDCMAQIARRLEPDDIAAVSGWLAAQPVPKASAPQRDAGADLPMRCGSVDGDDATQVDEPAVDRPVGRRPPAEAATIARGAYLAKAGNCAGCHTARGGASYAGGRGVETPFGTVFAPNLTPDAETGLGRWDADDFWRAMHEGRSKGGRALYPAFPYPQYTRIRREDSDAIFAFLRSLPPVRRASRPHRLRFPFDRQVVLEAWRWLFFRPASFVADGTRTAEWNRGAYLVTGLGHCGACHGARNAFGATRDPNRFDGETMPAQGWYAPSLHAADQGGVSDWPLEDVVRLLQVGVTDRASVSGPMGEVVRMSTQYLDEPDLGAIAVYLKSLPSREADASRGPNDHRGATVRGESRPARFERGSTRYRENCAQCHGDEGEGVTGAYPALAGNRAVTLDPPVNLVRIAAHGGFAVATRGNPRPFGMPPFTQVLDDAGLAEILSFVRNAWGNRAPMLNAADVARDRGSAGQ